MSEDWETKSFEIAQKIKHRLNECGLLRKDFAKLMEVSPSVVTKMLSGKCNFELFTIFKIEEKLGITIIDLTKNK